MKPPPFEYRRATSVRDAIEALAAAGDEGKVLAGGQSLVPMLNFRLVSPRVLVDLNGIPGLRGIERTPGSLRIGAMTNTRQLEIDTVVADTLPLLRVAASWVGHVQIRNRGTVGGSIAHADPAAELPAVALLLDAQLAIEGPSGVRTIEARDFFQGYFTTALASDEVLTAIDVPLPTTPSRWGFAEFAYRHGDFALAGATCLLETSEDGVVTSARLACFGLGETPVRLSALERGLCGERLTVTSIAEAADLAIGVVRDIDDARSDAPHRRRLIGELTKQALTQALGRAA